MTKSRYKLLNCSRHKYSYVYDVLNFSLLEVQRFTTKELLNLYNTPNTLIENLVVHSLLGKQYVSPVVIDRYRNLISRVVEIETNQDIALYIEYRSSFFNIYYMSKKDDFKQLYCTNISVGVLKDFRVSYTDEVIVNKKKNEVYMLLGIDLVTLKGTKKLWVLIGFTTKGTLRKIELSSLEEVGDNRTPMLTSTLGDGVKVDF